MPNAKRPPRSRVPAQLKAITAGLSLKAADFDEVGQIGRLVAGDERAISPADLAQLRDYATVLARIADAQRAADAVKIADPGVWLRMTGQIQRDQALKRGLLRDLAITRTIRSARQAVPKKRPDGGVDWTGVL